MMYVRHGVSLAGTLVLLTLSMGLWEVARIPEVPLSKDWCCQDSSLYLVCVCV